jgi:hypothetical protein
VAEKARSVAAMVMLSGDVIIAKEVEDFQHG